MPPHTQTFRQTLTQPSVIRLTSAMRLKVTQTDPKNDNITQ